ncbi:cyclic GMP-AMP synthase-like [Bactrocera tryoni]|uniref:cyclic GMP-AMP synthase-like n=1 Tax=Bactrocera tryoni TaxID=59916 RepID=UPI001A96849A|nr:cyclic GMP-AMP synthase-like [Bactrocera tryoni]
MDEIFAKINSEINIKRYKREYMAHFEVLRDTIFTALKKNQTFAALYNGNYLRGSYADNLKVKYPNEYDLVFRLKLPEEKRILVVKDKKIPGNVKLDLSEVLHVIINQKQHVNTYKQLKKMVTSESLLSIQLLQSWLESCFTKALDDINKKIIYNDITTTLSYSKQGPAHTISVKEPYMYSVDFVPAIVLISSKAILPSISKNWDAIPKPLKFIHSDTSFRASYDNLENEMIKNKNNLKNALRIIKKFRDIHTNMHNLKSYYIKTLFLWRASREPEKFWYQPIGFVVIQLFTDLSNSLEMCKLPFYWDPKLNLYEQIGESGLTDIRRCVQSKKKILENYIRLKVRTEVDHLKVYKTFLTITELKENGLIKSSAIPEDKSPEKIELKSSEPRRCIIQ